MDWGVIKEEKNAGCVKCELPMTHLLLLAGDIDLGVSTITIYVLLKSWDWMKSAGKGREDSQDKALRQFSIERLGVEDRA